MAVPRNTTPRGFRVPVGGSGSRRREVPSEPEFVLDPGAPRRRIDYSMQRRALLRSVFGGNVFNGLDICDADTYLLRAAKFHGVDTERTCPICRKAALAEVTYAFGDELGHVSGSAVNPDSLREMATRYGEFRVYVVEVCGQCRWNHLLTSYSLGDGQPRRIPAHPRDLETM